MKKFKNILLLIMVFTMAMSMCAFNVTANEATTKTGEVTTDLMIFNFEKLYAGNTYSSGRTFSNDSNSLISENITLRSSGSNKSNDTSVMEDSVRGKYIKTAHDRFGVATAHSIEEYMNDSGNPVVSISYDIMIPSNENTYKGNRRYGNFQVGATAVGGTTITNNINTYIENGVISAGATNAEASYTDTLAYSYDSWVTFKAHTWRTDDGYLQFAIYADDTLIYYGKGTKLSPGMRLSNVQDLRYFSDAANTKVAGTDGTSYTCYDNLKFQLLPESAKIDQDYVDGVIAEKEALKNPSVEFKTDENGNLDVSTKKYGKPLESGVLLIAIYSINGGMDELIPVRNITDGVINYEITADKLSTLSAGQEIKGFLFDDISSAIPLMKHGEYEVK